MSEERLRSREQIRTALVALGTLAMGGVAVGMITWGVGRAPMALMAGCPPRGDFVAVIVSRTLDSDGDSVTSPYYAVFDVRTGRPVGRTLLDSSNETMDHAFCARADDDRNWVVGYDAKPELYANVAPRRLVTWDSIARTSSIAGRVTGVGWSDDRGELVVNTSLGYAFALDPNTLRGTRVEGTPSLSTLSGPHDDVVPPGVVEYYMGGRDELRLADGSLLELEGHPRARVTSASTPLFGGRDFLTPAFLLSPTTRSIEWTDPPSVIVIEETEIGSRVFRATRIALDGTVTWTFTPQAPTAASWRYRPIPWAAYSEGRMLVTFDETSMHGIDPGTGRERWVTAYQDEP